MLAQRITALAVAVATQFKAVTASINVLQPLPIKKNDTTPVPPGGKHLMIFSTINKTMLYWNGTKWTN